MPQHLVGERAPGTVQTRVWLTEHEWLHQVFSCGANHSPRFRLPDLLGACVSLALCSPEGVAKLRAFLVTELSSRDPRQARRTCHVWCEQFDILMLQHRAPWNCHPNPKFELDAIATACVAVARAGDDAVAAVLRQARANLTARARSASSLN